MNCLVYSQSAHSIFTYSCERHTQTWPSIKQDQISEGLGETNGGRNLTSAAHVSLAEMLIEEIWEFMILFYIWNWMLWKLDW